MAAAEMLHVIALTDLLAGGLIVPVMAPYLRMIGAAHVSIGTVMSTFLFLQLVSASYTSRWSSQKALQGSLLICCATYFLLASTSSVATVFVCRSVLGLFQHTQLHCGNLLAKIKPDENQSLRKQLATFGPLSFVFGGAIAGNMMEYRGGYQYTCYIIALICLANFSIAYFFIPSAASEEKQKNLPQESLLKPLSDLVHVKWSQMGLTLALTFLLDFVFMAHLTNLAPVLWEVHRTPPRWIGYTMALQGLAGIGATYLTSWVTYKHPLQQTCRAFAVLTLSCAMLYIAPSWNTLVPCLLVLGLGCSLVRQSTTELVKSKNIMAPAQTVSSAAKIAAPIITGLTYDYFGFEGTASLRVLVSAAGCALAFLLLKQENKQK